MPLYQHRFQGSLPPGDIFVFSWWSDSSLSIDASHGNAVTWAEDAWDGPGAGDGIEAYLVPGVVINRITTGLITLDTGQQQSLRETTTALAGTAVGGSLPPEVALVVSLRTPLANRSGRGRFYLPTLAASAAAADGTVDAAAQAAIVAALESAWATANSAGETPVVYSRTNRSVQAITTFNVGDLFDVQTRRQNSLTESRVSAAMP